MVTELIQEKKHLKNVRNLQEDGAAFIRALRKEDIKIGLRS